MGKTMLRIEDAIKRGKRKQLVEAAVMLLLFAALAGVIYWKFIMK
jgi:hypothetical protein